MLYPARPLFRVSVAVIVLFEFAALGCRSFFELHLLAAGVRGPLAKDLSYLVVPPLLLLLMSPYAKRCKAGLFRLLAVRPCLRLIMFAVMLGLVMRLTWWAAMTAWIAFRVPGTQPGISGAATLITFVCPPPVEFLLSIAVMAVLVPIVEEIVNRGVVLHSLLSRGAAFALVVSSLVFAILHNVQNAPAAFVGGLCFGTLMLNCGNLWGPVIAHATYNAASVIDWECGRIFWTPHNAAAGPLLIGIVSLLVAVSGLLLMIWLSGPHAAGARIAPRRQ